MNFFLLLHLLALSDLFAYQEVTNCESKFVKKQWRSYESAKQHVQSLGIKTSRQFQKWSRSGQRPEDFPSNPRNTYKSEWKSWGEFLGTSNVHKKDVRSYESAKQYVQDQGIKTRNQFREWAQSDDRPADIPLRPDYVYRLKWISWSEFLGTGRGSKKGWRSYESAEALMKELGISEERQFRKWRRSGERPLDFPSNPDRVYKSEWNGWGAFLWDSELSEGIGLSEAIELLEDMGIDF